MVTWLCKSFAELNSDQLYHILQLRADIFVVEQDCAYQDLDDKDQGSMHLMGYIDNELMAYTRILPPGLSYDEACSIGRVVVKGSYRKTGLGKALMHESMRRIAIEFEAVDEVRISAQEYLDAFYTELGFTKTGKKYLEDGIPHQEMVARTKEK